MPYGLWLMVWPMIMACALWHLAYGLWPMAQAAWAWARPRLGLRVGAGPNFGLAAQAKGKICFGLRLGSRPS